MNPTYTYTYKYTQRTRTHLYKHPILYLCVMCVHVVSAIRSQQDTSVYKFSCRSSIYHYCIMFCAQFSLLLRLLVALSLSLFFLAQYLILRSSLVDIKYCESLGSIVFYFETKLRNVISQPKNHHETHIAPPSKVITDFALRSPFALSQSLDVCALVFYPTLFATHTLVALFGCFLLLGR